MIKKRLLLIGMLVFTLFMTACQGGVEPIKFGEDQCDLCSMTIDNPKYGAEVITSNGEVYKFDAIECMIPFINENAAVDYDQLLAVAFDAPEKLYAVEQLTFARSSKYKSPMGANLAAFKDASKIDEEAEQMSWKALKDGMMAH